MWNLRSGALLGACMVSMVIANGVSRAETPPLKAEIHLDRQHKPVSPYVYGMFIEPIGSLVARTLWAEMLDDRKFYFPVVDAAHDPKLPAGPRHGRRCRSATPGVTIRQSSVAPLGAHLAVPAISTSIYEFPLTNTQ